MAKRDALARRTGGALVIAQNANELEDLLRAEGMQRRSPFSVTEAEIPDGIYYERSEGKIVVWVPPDPRLSTGNGMIPTSVELSLTDDARGTRVRVRQRSNGATRMAVAVMLITTLATVAAFAATGVGAGFWIMGLFTWAIAWAVMGLQWRVASQRNHMAWDAMSPLLSKLALHEGDAVEDPYRGE